MNTDAYQPIERERRITRSLLEVMVQYRHPVSIITKGALILRDLDLLSELARDQLCTVAVSLTTLDNDLKRRMEPRTAAPATRLRVIERLVAAGIPVSILIAPVIPFINDHEIERILEAAQQAGATRAGWIMLRLPLELDTLFQDWLRRHFPDRAEHVMNRIRDLRGGRSYDATFGQRMTGTGPYADLIRQRFRVPGEKTGPERRPGAGPENRSVPSPGRRTDGALVTPRRRPGAAGRIDFIHKKNKVIPFTNYKYGDDRHETPHQARPGRPAGHGFLGPGRPGATAARSQLAMQGDGSGAPCLACHGADGAGNDAAGFPRLAGLDADYLAKQMLDYNAGKRVSPIMQPNIDNFDEQQLRDLAAYYASLPAPASAAPANVSDAQLALGRKLATEGDWDTYIPPCSSCHGPGNRGVGHSFPALAGQHPSYIRAQLQAWQNNQRNNDPNQLMTAIAERLTAQQIDAVAAYLGSLSATAE